MSTEDSSSSVTVEELVDYLRDNFIPTDNIPEDTAARNAICMEARASLLIDNCSIGDLSRFFRTTPVGAKLILTLPQPLCFTVPQCDYPKCNWKWRFTHYVIEASCGEKDYFGCQGRWRINDIPPDPLCTKPGTWTRTSSFDDIYKALAHFLNDPNCFMNIGRAAMDSREMISNCLKEHFEGQSTFQLAQPLTEYNTPIKVCHFFGSDTLPFAQLKQQYKQLRSEYAQYKSILEPVVEGQSEAETVHNYLKEMFTARLLPHELLAKATKRYDTWLSFIFPFTDKNNNVVMSVLKRYDDTFQRKSFIPITRWGRTYSSACYCLAVPCQNLQPLYHLYELLQYKSAIVILTDSLEIAEINQAKWSPEEVIFTSFICDSGHYEQVDWSPLRERTVYCLITNHSGKTLEEAWLDIERLSNYLAEEESKITIKYIRLPVLYHRLPVMHNVEDMLEARHRDQPSVVADDVSVLNPNEFAEISLTAASRIRTHPEAWWKTARETSAPAKQNVDESFTSYAFLIEKS